VAPQPVQERPQGPFNFGEELSTVINSYRQLPFSHPEETGENSGSIRWGRSLSLRRQFPRLGDANKELSYPHYAAYYAQCQYVSQKILKDPTLVKGDGEMSILLSASVGIDSELERFLLQAGADPQEQVRLGDQRNPDTRTTTVWMLFLFSFATSALSGRYRPSFDHCSSALEEYLKFGVDIDIFLVYLQPGASSDYREIVISQNEGEIRTRGKKQSKQPEQELFSISLEELVRLSQPKNLDSLQTLLLDKAKWPFWRKASSVISKFLSLIEPSIPITSEYKAFEFKELGYSEFNLHSVCSKTCQLERDFRVQIM
jgi:hypothetical protein